MDIDKRINNGVIELLCFYCNEWKPFDMDSWGFFPEEEHECRVCYDKRMEKEIAEDIELI